MIEFKSRFIELFGEVSKNEKGWDVDKLSSISEVTSSRRVFAKDFVESGIPFYRGSEISELSEFGHTVPKYFISKDHYDNLVSTSGKPVYGDILLPSICANGELWVVNTNEPFYIKDGRVLWIKVNQKLVNSVFLMYQLKSHLIINFNRMASGSTFSEMKIFKLKKIPIMLPPLDLQKQFVDFYSQVDKSKVIYDI